MTSNDDPGPFETTLQWDAAQIETLIERIYAASFEPETWSEVTRLLSGLLGDVPVTVWMRLPNPIAAPVFYSAGLDANLWPAFFEHFDQGLPWGNQTLPEVTQGFSIIDRVISNEELERTPFYREWMEPQGIAPRSPMVFVFRSQNERPLGGMGIQQLLRRPPFGEAELAFVNRLAPHLRRAFEIHCRLQGLQRHHFVLSEVIDRMPTGILLLDGQGRVLASNRAATLTLEDDRGLHLREGRVEATHASRNRDLQERLRHVTDPESSGRLADASVMNVATPDAERPLPILISPLLAPPLVSAEPEAAAVMLIGDARVARVSRLALLRATYRLTPAEAELTQLLCEGLSLEEAAERRGIRTNTARGQLKHVFAKTGARRQGDLVRIVLGGVATLGGD